MVLQSGQLHRRVGPDELLSEQFQLFLLVPFQVTSVLLGSLQVDAVIPQPDQGFRNGDLLNDGLGQLLPGLCLLDIEGDHLLLDARHDQLGRQDL